MDKVANRPRGFAFLRYETEEESKKAIEGMHGKVWFWCFSYESLQMSGLFRMRKYFIMIILMLQTNQVTNFSYENL